MIKKLRSCKVETHFLSERENHRLKVLFSSDGDRISHVSCASEKYRVGSAVDCTLHIPSVRAPARETGWYREISSLVPFRDGAFLRMTRTACSRQHNADGHACMSRAQCGVCYRQAVRDRDEAKRNRGAETDWHAVRTEPMRRTGRQSGRTGSGKYYTGNTARVYHDAVCCTADSGKE